MKRRLDSYWYVGGFFIIMVAAVVVEVGVKVYLHHHGGCW